MHELPGGSDGKDSPWNAGDSSLIPGLRRSLGEGMATHSSILAGEFQGQRSQGVAKSQT